MRTFVYTLFALLFTGVLFTACSDDDGATSITAVDYTASIDENSASGTSLGTVSSSASNGTALSYSIATQSIANAVSINSTTGELTINNEDAFDYETNSTITGTIDITAGNVMKSVNFTINVNNIYAKKVLLAGAEGATLSALLDDVKSKIENTALFETVDVVNISNVTPSTDDLKKYDVVLVWTDGTPENRQQMGNNLAEFIEAGGAVVGAAFEADFERLQGNYNFSYQVYDTRQNIGQAGGRKRSYDSTKSDTTHPILKNISSYNGGPQSYHSVGLKPSAGATVIARYDNNTPLVLVKEFASHNTRGVYLNMFPPSSDAESDFWDTSTDGALLMANALKWAGEK